ncbi:hypothetical protein B7463_g11889, partial [Scytalidium lignicola]
MGRDGHADMLEHVRTNASVAIPIEVFERRYLTPQIPKADWYKRLGAFWLGFGATQTPSFNAQGFFTSGNPDIDISQFYSSYAFGLVFTAVLVAIYALCAFRLNVVFVGIFSTLTFALICLAASYWCIGHGNPSAGNKLQKAGGALTFAVCVMAWYYLLSLLLESVDFPLRIPVGDLSRRFEGATARNINKMARTPYKLFHRDFTYSRPSVRRPFSNNIREAYKRSSIIRNASIFHSFPGTSYILFTALVGAGVAATFGILPKSINHNQPTYGLTEDFDKALIDLREKLGDDAISTDEDDLYHHGYSEWSSTNAQRLPMAVAYPRSTAEVSEIAKTCHQYRIPMIPYSGGSSLEANSSAPYGGVTIDFMFMDRIIKLHEEDMDVVVQPSIQWMQLNKDIKNTGLFFPVDPGPSAKIGGMVGTNCSGTNAVRYGTMKDWVINLTVVLADGRIIKTRRRPRKTSAGYNLTGLFTGSEGTLGLVTEITLKLCPIPEQTRVGVVTFSDMRKAATAAMQIIRKGISVQCMEILDEVQMEVINRAGGTSRVWKEAPTLFFKFSGTLGQVADSIALTRALIQADADTFEFANNEEEARTLWSARKEALWSMITLGGESSYVWTTDVAVPISKLPEIIELSKKELDDLGVFAGIVGHIGDGNFHEIIMHDKQDQEERNRVEKCVHNMVERALEMEGSCTGEHGIGLGKKESLLQELGPETIAVMRQIKPMYTTLELEYQDQDRAVNSDERDPVAKTN